MRLFRAIAVITQYDEVIANPVSDFHLSKESAENEILAYINNEYGGLIESMNLEITYESDDI